MSVPSARWEQLLSALAQLGLPPLPIPLAGTVIDSHTHLDATLEVSGLPVELNLAAAAAVGVRSVVEIGCDVPSSRWAVQVAKTYPQVVACVAIHPNDAARMSDDELEQALAVIDELATETPYVRGIGETGLDYYRTRDANAQQRQRRAFAAHIAIAAKHRLTLAIHDRDAHGDILKTLDAGAVPERVVMHCFSGDTEFATQCLARGAWLSFPGVLTYRANEYLREVLALTPLHRILIETDAPYLTAVPERGKRNAPYLMAHTLRFMASELNIAEAELCALLTANAETAYGGSWGRTFDSKGETSLECALPAAPPPAGGSYGGIRQ
ncbi:MAG: TatD family hydrolase [Propionibacteriaceae bacterium]|nr:TatD family hydrolase [Propionibacteriaceae bacterium]